MNTITNDQNREKKRIIIKKRKEKEEHLCYRKIMQLRVRIETGGTNYVKLRSSTLVLNTKYKGKNIEKYHKRKMSIQIYRTCCNSAMLFFFLSKLP